MLYMVPMLLGRTYDIGKDLTGADIFAQDDIAKARIIENYHTDSRYTLVDRSTDVKNFLDISGSLSLKIKALGLQIGGGGSYLKDTAQRTKYTEILVRVHYETITKTLHSSTKPLPNWKKFANLGTHFCRSITYGGDLIASVQFKAEREEDKEKIKAHVQGELQVGGSFDAKIQGKLSKLQENLKGTASMEINYYATVPVHGIPRTLKSLMEIAGDFSNHTKDINDGLGVPLNMELYPLSFLDNFFPPDPNNAILEPYMNRLEMQLDDLLATKRMITDWLSTIPPLQPPKFLQSIAEFQEKIENILDQFRQTISDLDVSSAGRTEQFLLAYRLYKGEGTSLPDKYLRQFLRLKNKLETEYPEIRADFGGVNYVNWGKDKCDVPGLETSYSGKIVKSEKNSFCLPTDGHLEKAKILSSSINPVVTDVSCSLCHATNRTVMFVQAGQKNCPDGWFQEYEGILVEGGSYFCLNREENTKIPFTRVSVACGILPCDYYKEKQLNCIVCTK